MLSRLLFYMIGRENAIGIHAVRQPGPHFLIGQRHMGPHRTGVWGGGLGLVIRDMADSPFFVGGSGLDRTA
ncbi:MAG TPA: hypothetical protein DCZ91_14285 [Lachnospiraceae bacterium]|nr:hypothetical protein [Lachnospiraceae bacterium]